MNWLQLFLHAHPQLFGYCLLGAMVAFLFVGAALSISDQLRAERWRDWHRAQRPRRF